MNRLGTYTGNELEVGEQENRNGNIGMEERETVICGMRE